MVLAEAAATRFRSGQVVEYAGEAELGPGYVVPVLDAAGDMIGIGETFKVSRVAPEIVLAR